MSAPRRKSYLFPHTREFREQTCPLGRYAKAPSTPFSPRRNPPPRAQLKVLPSLDIPAGGLRRNKRACRKATCPLTFPEASSGSRAPVVRHSPSQKTGGCLELFTSRISLSPISKRGPVLYVPWVSRPSW